MYLGLFWHIFLIMQMQRSTLFEQGAHSQRRKAPRERPTETVLFPVLMIRLVSWTERCPKLKGGSYKAHLAIGYCHASLIRNTKSRGF